LSDVATLAGVSVTTASFVLSGRRDMRISEGTQERVHQAARELSYVPRNPMGASLPVQAPSIGFISDTVGTEPFAGELIRGCVTAATERGHSLLMTETEGLRTLEVSESRELVDRGVGQFLFASMAMRVTALPPNLRGKPVVMLNCIDRRRSVPSVVPDDLAAGRRAAAELVDAGHGDRIMLVGEVATMVYRAASGSTASSRCWRSRATPCSAICPVAGGHRTPARPCCAGSDTRRRSGRPR
jgi:LacI family transcriptional regulator